MIRGHLIMSLNFKPQRYKKPICSVDYLTVVFCPNELARLKMQAKLHLGNGDFKTYKAAYNALICSEVFNEDATDDLELTSIETSANFKTSDDYFDKLFKSNLKEKYVDGTDVDAFFKTVVKQTHKYKTLNKLIEGDISYFMRLLNEEVATRADRYNEDEQPWTFRESMGGMFTYEKSATLYRHGINSGMVAWGANNGGCMVSFSGSGCAGLDIPKLHNMLKKMPNVKITRLDIAYDDMNGKRDINHYVRALEEGQFCKTNQAPNFSFIQTGCLQKLSKLHQQEYRAKHGWQKRYDMVADAGNTLYVGSRRSGKMARMYEKGKQLNSETQQEWVRAELELRAIDRIISLDALLNIDGIFAAAYPAFEFVSEERLEVPTNQRKKIVLATNDRLVKYQKLAYGKHVNFMRHILELSDTDIVNLLTDGLGQLDMPASLANALIQPPNFNDNNQLN